MIIIAPFTKLRTKTIPDLLEEQIEQVQRSRLDPNQKTRVTVRGFVLPVELDAPSHVVFDKSSKKYYTLKPSSTYSDPSAEKQEDNVLEKETSANATNIISKQGGSSFGGVEYSDGGDAFLMEVQSTPLPEVSTAKAAVVRSTSLSDVVVRLPSDPASNLARVRSGTTTRSESGVWVLDPIKTGMHKKDVNVSVHWTLKATALNKFAGGCQPFAVAPVAREGRGLKTKKIRESSLRGSRRGKDTSSICTDRTSTNSQTRSLMGSKTSSVHTQVFQNSATDSFSSVHSKYDDELNDNENDSQRRRRSRSRDDRSQSRQKREKLRRKLRNDRHRGRAKRKRLRFLRQQKIMLAIRSWYTNELQKNVRIACAVYLNVPADRVPRIALGTAWDRMLAVNSMQSGELPLPIGGNLGGFQLPVTSTVGTTHIVDVLKTSVPRSMQDFPFTRTHTGVHMSPIDTSIAAAPPASCEKTGVFESDCNDVPEKMSTMKPTFDEYDVDSPIPRKAKEVAMSNASVKALSGATPSVGSSPLWGVETALNDPQNTESRDGGGDPMKTLTLPPSQAGLNAENTGGSSDAPPDALEHTQASHSSSSSSSASSMKDMETTRRSTVHSRGMNSSTKDGTQFHTPLSWSFTSDTGRDTDHDAAVAKVTGAAKPRTPTLSPELLKRQNSRPDVKGAIKSRGSAFPGSPTGGYRERQTSVGCDMVESVDIRSWAVVRPFPHLDEMNLIPSPFCATVTNAPVLQQQGGQNTFPLLDVRSTTDGSPGLPNADKRGASRFQIEELARPLGGVTHDYNESFRSDAKDNNADGGSELGAFDSGVFGEANGERDATVTSLVPIVGGGGGNPEVPRRLIVQNRKVQMLPSVALMCGNDLEAAIDLLKRRSHLQRFANIQSFSSLQAERRKKEGVMQRQYFLSTDEMCPDHDAEAMSSKCRRAADLKKKVSRKSKRSPMMPEILDQPERCKNGSVAVNIARERDVYTPTNTPCSLRDSAFSRASIHGSGTTPPFADDLTQDFKETMEHIVSAVPVVFTMTVFSYVPSKIDFSTVNATALPTTTSDSECTPTEVPLKAKNKGMFHRLIARNGSSFPVLDGKANSSKASKHTVGSPNGGERGNYAETLTRVKYSSSSLPQLDNTGSVAQLAASQRTETDMDAPFFHMKSGSGDKKHGPAFGASRSGGDPNRGSMNVLTPGGGLQLSTSATWDVHHDCQRGPGGGMVARQRSGSPAAPKRRGARTADLFYDPLLEAEHFTKTIVQKNSSEAGEKRSENGPGLGGSPQTSWFLSKGVLNSLNSGGKGVKRGDANSSALVTVNRRMNSHDVEKPGRETSLYLGDDPPVISFMSDISLSSSGSSESSESYSSSYDNSGSERSSRGSNKSSFFSSVRSWMSFRGSQHSRHSSRGGRKRKHSRSRNGQRKEPKLYNVFTGKRIRTGATVPIARTGGDAAEGVEEPGITVPFSAYFDNQTHGSYRVFNAMSLPNMTENQSATPTPLYTSPSLHQSFDGRHLGNALSSPLPPLVASPTGHGSFNAGSAAAMKADSSQRGSNGRGQKSLMMNLFKRGGGGNTSGKPGSFNESSSSSGNRVPSQHLSENTPLTEGGEEMKENHVRKKSSPVGSTAVPFPEVSRRAAVLSRHESRTVAVRLPLTLLYTADRFLNDRQMSAVLPLGQIAAALRCTKETQDANSDNLFFAKTDVQPFSTSKESDASPDALATAASSRDFSLSRSPQQQPHQQQQRAVSQAFSGFSSIDATSSLGERVEESHSYFLAPVKLKYLTIEANLFAVVEIVNASVSASEALPGGSATSKTDKRRDQRNGHGGRGNKSSSKRKGRRNSDRDETDTSESDDEEDDVDDSFVRPRRARRSRSGRRGNSKAEGNFSDVKTQTTTRTKKSRDNRHSRDGVASPHQTNSKNGGRADRNAKKVTFSAVTFVKQQEDSSGQGKRRYGPKETVFGPQGNATTQHLTKKKKSKSGDPDSPSLQRGDGSTSGDDELLPEDMEMLAKLADALPSRTRSKKKRRSEEGSTEGSSESSTSESTDLSSSEYSRKKRKGDDGNQRSERKNTNKKAQAKRRTKRGRRSADSDSSDDEEMSTRSTKTPRRHREREEEEESSSEDQTESSEDESDSLDSDEEERRRSRSRSKARRKRREARKKSRRNNKRGKKKSKRDDSTSSSTNSSDDEEDATSSDGGEGNQNSHGLCLLCVSNQASVVFLPCGHFATCRTCSRKLNACPVCRTALVYSIVLYQESTN